MRIGKLTNQELESIVLKRLPPLSPSTLTGAAVGSDCARVRMKELSLYVSTDPVTAGGSEAGRLSIHVSCNDLAACGISPSAIMLVVIAPPSATVEDLETVISQASETAKILGVDIVGGHTEVSDAVNRFVVVTTAFGIPTDERYQITGKAMPGDTLLMTKTAALEGSLIAASEFASRLKSGLTEEEIGTARNFVHLLSVVPEGVAAASCRTGNGASEESMIDECPVHAMHDITEGGVYGAAHEMATLSGIGITLFHERIPIHPITRKITETLHLDPMRLISSGSLLIAAKAPEQVCQTIRSLGVPCTAIGVFTADSMLLKTDDGCEYVLTAPEADELYKLYS